MSKLIVPIKGMHCRSCELLVKEELTQLAGVKQVSVSAKTHQAELIVDHEAIDETEIAAAVSRAGYELGSSEALPLITQNSQAWQQVGLMTILVGLSWFLMNRLGWQTGFGSNFTSQPSSLLTVLLVGLTAGVSTCMALVGGLVMAISAKFAKANSRANLTSKLEPILAFQAGRIVGFAVLGGLLGLLGSAITPSPLVTSVLTLGVAMVMILLSLQLTGLFPRLANWSISLPSWLVERLGLRFGHQASYSIQQTAITGALTFFVPCGFTQSMQLLAASSGSVISGALIMTIFALGTLPGLSLAGSFGLVLTNQTSQLFTRFVGVIVVAMALTSLATGLNLFQTANNLAKFSSVNTSAPMGEVQEIRMVQKASGYSPNSFTVKKGRPVKWIIDSQDSYSCASSILLAKYGINTVLKPGENTFLFTPEQVGSLKFSCGMGMYNGVIKVTE